MGVLSLKDRIEQKKKEESIAKSGEIIEQIRKEHLDLEMEYDLKFGKTPLSLEDRNRYNQKLAKFSEDAYPHLKNLCELVLSGRPNIIGLTEDDGNILNFQYSGFQMQVFLSIFDPLIVRYEKCTIEVYCEKFRQKLLGNIYADPEDCRIAFTSDSPKRALLKALKFATESDDVVRALKFATESNEYIQNVLPPKDVGGGSICCLDEDFYKL